MRQGEKLKSPNHARSSCYKGDSRVIVFFFYLLFSFFHLFIYLFIFGGTRAIYQICLKMCGKTLFSLYPSTEYLDIFQIVLCRDNFVPRESEVGEVVFSSIGIYILSRIINISATSHHFISILRSGTNSLLLLFLYSTLYFITVRIK